MANRVELALDCRCELGEGPIWDDRIGRLLFVDINAHAVHTFDPATGAHQTFDAGEYVSAVALDARGGYVIALQHDFAFFDLVQGVSARLASVETARPDTRFNDGYVDARGRFWAGTMSLERKAGQGGLYRLDPDRQVTHVLDGVTTSNGIDWTAEGRRMYYVDTGTRRIDVFDCDPATGAIANRRAFVTIAESDGKPDGLVLDDDDFVWVALWQGSAVRRYAPDGRLDLQIDLPVSCPTKCAFGGTNLDTLYITSAKAALTAAERESQPHAGSLFVAKPGARGRIAHRFGR